ncbi:hypothetical protein A2853_01630 [Candidatus Kaiserbacteria bacterium RIFCSPHIGHO2_01_FULL_55_17]|uniref:Uncharacterized protein n=1 Tax=Candidatus Kaiserbacteria bacterium RIFCSPHIGHO2_01_FULL_55_17 TaxID=1798484 RepID=A0A1F6D8A4_9BACT|nr:MAG: hypothetical protein A2853_01630 [Candidatus Kaiserbacteria bacterium RIFCSPHIGHO2_01_FULL_55_17]
MNKNSTELLAEMERVFESGGDKALEEFVIAHFKELPVQVQKQALFGFFSEALEKQAGDAQIADIQRQGIDSMKIIASVSGQRVI